MNARDLAELIRHALRDKRQADQLAFERSRAYITAAFWGTVAAVLTIAGGLTLAMCTVHLWY